MCRPVHSPSAAPQNPSPPRAGSAPEHTDDLGGFFRAMLENPPWSVVALLVAADLIDLPIVTRAVWAGIGLVSVARAARRRLAVRRANRPPADPD